MLRRGQCTSSWRLASSFRTSDQQILRRSESGYWIHSTQTRSARMEDGPIPAWLDVEVRLLRCAIRWASVPLRLSSREMGGSCAGFDSPLDLLGRTRPRQPTEVDAQRGSATAYRRFETVWRAPVACDPHFSTSPSIAATITHAHWRVLDDDRSVALRPASFSSEVSNSDHRPRSLANLAARYHRIWFFAWRSKVPPRPRRDAAEALVSEELEQGSGQPLLFRHRRVSAASPPGWRWLREDRPRAEDLSA